MRSLVLTHTNSGVGVIRGRLKERRVPASRAFVSTIDGWCLRLVKAYPRTAGIRAAPDLMPPWQEIREGAVRILAKRFAGVSCERVTGWSTSMSIRTARWSSMLS